LARVLDSVAGLPTAIIGDRVAPALHELAIGWLRTVADAGMLLGLYRGRNARTGRCRVPIGREGGGAENACSVNWAFVSSMLL
jgi:hypothetical protein